MSIKSLSVFAVLKNKKEEEKEIRKERKKESEQLTKKGMKEQTGRQKEAAYETKAF